MTTDGKDAGWHEDMPCPDGWRVRRLTDEDLFVHDDAIESADGGWVMEPLIEEAA